MTESEMIEKIKELEERIQSLENAMAKMSEDFYEEDEFTIDIVCPYCDNEFEVDYDESRAEVNCPECNNTIELDWSGDLDDDFEGGCSGHCSGCHGCGDEE